MRLKNARKDAVKLGDRSEEHTSELQSPCNLVCRLLLEKKKTKHTTSNFPTAPTSSSPRTTMTRFTRWSSSRAACLEPHHCPYSTRTSRRSPHLQQQAKT